MANFFAKNYVMDAKRTAKGLQSLLGIMGGLVCDGHLNDDEIRYLKTWMLENGDLAEVYPASIMYRRVNEILFNGVII